MSDKSLRVKSRDIPSQSDLTDHLRYDPSTGHLYWIKPAQGRKTSAPAGTKWKLPKSKYWRERAYYKIYFNGKIWMSHRIIWIMAYGSIPSDMQIDHIDGDGLNNRLENLRLVTPKEQARNKAMPMNNTSGATGVRRYEGDTRCWTAWVGNTRIGIYGSKREAEERVISHRLLLGYHKNHGRS